MTHNLASGPIVFKFNRPGGPTEENRCFSKLCFALLHFPGQKCDLDSDGRSWANHNYEEKYALEFPEKMKSKICLEVCKVVMVIEYWVHTVTAQYTYAIWT